MHSSRHPRLNHNTQLYSPLNPQTLVRFFFLDEAWPHKPFPSVLPSRVDGAKCRLPQKASLCGEADPAALHADFQAIRRLAAGVHDAAVHVAGTAAVVAQFLGAAAAAAADLGRAGAARGLRHHHVAKGQELAKQAGQDAVDAAVWVKTSQAVRLDTRQQSMHETCEGGFVTHECDY